MTLGEFIQALGEMPMGAHVQIEGVDPDRRMVPGECCGPSADSAIFFTSYRGRYDEIALAYDDGVLRWWDSDLRQHRERGVRRPTVADVYNEAMAAVGKVFQGWKGGDFRMGRGTPLWLAPAGSATGFIPVEVVLGTAHTGALIKAVDIGDYA